jgi:cytochrome c oxidase cbb3-type subunit 3
MRSATLILTAGLIVIATGCTGPPTEDASEGAAPAVTIPVGPVPGPKVALNMPKNPYGAEDPITLAEGRRLFVSYNCYGCHGGHAGGGMGPSLRDQDWIYGGSDAQVFDSIAEGRAKGMPAWGTKLPADQIWKIDAYIHSLGTNYEPSPPE